MIKLLKKINYSLNSQCIFLNFAKTRSRKERIADFSSLRLFEIKVIENCKRKAYPLFFVKLELAKKTPKKTFFSFKKLNQRIFAA